MKTLLKKVPYRIVAWAAVVIFSMIWMLHMLLPYVINMQSVRDWMMSRAAEAISADITYGTIEPALLPSPRVVVNQVSVAEPDQIAVGFRRLIIYPKLWPLLTGDLRIDRLKLEDPHGVLHWPLADVGMRQATNKNAMGTIQKRVSDGLVQVVGVLGRFQAKIVGGRLSIERAGRTDLLISQLNGRFTTAKGHLHIEMEGNSRLASRFHLEGEIDPQTLNSKGRVNITGLQTDHIKAMGFGTIGNHLPQMVVDLDIDFGSKGLESFQARYAAHSPKVILANGTRRLAIGDLRLDGHARWTPQSTEVVLSDLQTTSPGIQLNGTLKWSKTPRAKVPPIDIAFNGANLNLSRIRGALHQLYGDHPVIQRVLNIVRGGIVTSLTGSMHAEHWSAKKLMEQFRVECDLKGGRIMVPPDDLLDLEEVNGLVVIAKGRLTARDVTARLGNTRSKNGALELGLYDRSKAFNLDTLVEADLAELPPVLRKLIKNKAHLARLDDLPTLTGRASGRLILGDRLDRITARIIASSQIKTVDSDFDLIGTIDHLPGPKTSARVFLKGQLGSGVVDWLWLTAKIPPEYLLKTPFTIGHANITWNPPGMLTLVGDLERENGLRAAAVLTAQKRDFHLNRLHITAGASDAVVSFRRQKGGDQLDAGFQGYLDKPAVDKLFRKNKLLGGWMKGRFKVQFDRLQPERTTLHGPISIHKVDIPWGRAAQIRIIDASVRGLNRMFTVPSLSLKWDDQPLLLSGKGLFSQQALDLNLVIKADALNAKKLTPVLNSLKRDTKHSSAQANPILPIRGEAIVEIDQLDYHRYRIAPFHAAIDHSEKQTLVRVTSADVCGIQLPGHIRLSGGHVSMELQPRVIRTGLKAAKSCLLDAQHTERLEGIIDLNGRVTTNGKTNEELISNLRGTVDLHIEQGRIYNVGSAGLFTNLLSFLSINQYATGDLPDLSKNDFHYNRIDSQLVFGDGVIQIKEGVVKSNSVNMVADGQYHILSRDVDLKMLVSPLTTVDWIIERIPIIGNILGGTLVAIPVRVKGHQSDPKITPLALSAVGSRLGGILERTLKTPVRIIEPLFKDDEGEQSKKE